jgi:hypothetical protein
MAETGIPATPIETEPVVPVAETPETKPTEVETKNIPPAIALWAEVAAAATTKGSAVRELVVGELTQQEIIKRKDAVIALLGKYDEKTKELKKAENQGTWLLNANGAKVGDPSFTKEQVGVMKGLRDDIAKLSSALSNFFEKNDTNKLYELAKAPQEKK